MPERYQMKFHEVQRYTSLLTFTFTFNSHLLHSLHPSKRSRHHSLVHSAHNQQLFPGGMEFRAKVVCSLNNNNFGIRMLYKGNIQVIYQILISSIVCIVQLSVVCLIFNKLTLTYLHSFEMNVLSIFRVFFSYSDSD